METTDSATTPDLITRQEAADILGVSTRTVGRYMHDGRLKVYRGGRHGRNVRLARDDVNRLSTSTNPPYRADPENS